MIERTEPLKKEVVAREIKRLEEEITSTKHRHFASIDTLRAHGDCDLEAESMLVIHQATMKALKERLEFLEGMYSRMR